MSASFTPLGTAYTYIETLSREISSSCHSTSPYNVRGMLGSTSAAFSGPVDQSCSSPSFRGRSAGSFPDQRLEIELEYIVRRHANSFL